MNLSGKNNQLVTKLKKLKDKAVNSDEIEEGEVMACFVAAQNNDGYLVRAICYIIWRVRAGVKVIPLKVRFKVIRFGHVTEFSSGVNKHVQLRYELKRRGYRVQRDVNNEYASGSERAP